MDMTLRPMTIQERMYSYSQSQQIFMQTCCIGHLRGDMGTGREFFTTWNDHCMDKKTDEFKTELNEVINSLRFNKDSGSILKDIGMLYKYCYAHPDSRFDNNREFGFRADTDNYSYLLRLNPNRGEYNFYCYCYVRKWLDHHLKQAERGIRFIDPNYKEMFRIPDGDKIRIIKNNKTTDDHTCRYIDDYHLEVGREQYHICQFAEIMERNGSTVIPLRSSLPEQCYSLLAETGEVVIIKKGESGYYNTDIDMGDKEQNAALVEEHNQKLGVSKAQAEAMKNGSMFGWDTPAADPKNYNDNGKLIDSKHKDRGDTR